MEESGAPLRVRIQREDFDEGRELAALRRPGAGAVASFTGVVREQAAGVPLLALELEHYPGMTEKELRVALEEAQRRWPLEGICVIHRVGTLEPGENIVFVGVAAAHRREAFAACAFLVEYLKNRVPLWKKERTTQGEHWVECPPEDLQT